VVRGRCKKGSLPASFVAMMTTMYDRVSRVPARTGRFITPSAFLKGKLIEGGIKPEKITVIPNFVDVQSFRAGAGLSDEKADSPGAAAGASSPHHTAGAADGYYLYFGRLSREKGIDLLIDAVSGLGRGKLKIAGEGPLEGELKGHAAAAGADVEFLGFRTGAELRALLEKAMFVVVPSRWYENLPFSVMESLAAGRPVIAADIGGIPEMVEDGVNGMLFPPGDAGALRCRVARMLDDDAMRRRMSKAGREKAERLYGPGTHYEKIMEVYGELLGRRV
jgi:glycosyltransferase involved in cell wall biosynthesis